MFGGKLKKWEETRVFDYAFGDYPAENSRVGKKIGCRKILIF
jgi:hypothetical protein